MKIIKIYSIQVSNESGRHCSMLCKFLRVLVSLIFDVQIQGVFSGPRNLQQ